MKMFH